MNDVRRVLGCVGFMAAIAFGCAKGEDAGGSASSASPDGGSFDDDGGFGGGLDSGKGSKTCSDDLHTILDERGVAVKSCAADEGCADGKCIPACDAAAKNKGNVGCDFLVSTPLFDPVDRQPCFAVFVANNWTTNAPIKVSYDGMPLDLTTFARIPNGTNDPTTWSKLPASGLPAGQVAVLFLSNDPYAEHAGTSMRCPVATAISSATQRTDTGRMKAFHVTTGFPVSAYDIIPFGGARSYLPGATMLLPTSAWGTNYVAVTPYLDVAPFPLTDVHGGPLWAQIVAQKDDTHVEIRPKVDMPSGDGVDKAPADKVTTFTLKAGEVLQWTMFSHKMPGSVLASDKPIAFIGGTGELCMRSKTSPEGGGCDSAHQQIAPVSALGFDYAIAPYTTRRLDLKDESVPYRLVGAVDGTILTYDPPQPDAPTTLAAGQMIDFEVTSAFRVHGQDKSHPFYVAQSMSGGIVISGSRSGEGPEIVPGMRRGLGDEEYVSVLPPQQFQSSYVFFTDPTYATTNLVLTRVRGSAGFQDVTIDCLGTVSGWKAIGGSSLYEFTNIDLARGGTGPCTNGQHTAKSPGRFGLVVWGLDTWASYAYPAGGSASPINEVVVPVAIK